ncbi:hypothetical protein DJ523_06730 [Sulfolobus sp. E5]|nr:hypothetical protein DJ523_06730 [Sulfolobus sp. E5]
MTQASEKYYKAAEESIKLLVKILDIKEIMEKVRRRKTWESSILFKAARLIARKTNKYEVIRIWRAAWYLHILGFHEMKIKKERVKELSLLVHEIEKLLQFY